MFIPNHSIYTFLFILLSFPLFAQTFQGPIPPISEGFGAWGEHEVLIDSIDHPSYNNKFVTIFHPQNYNQPIPTIFYCHGYGITDYRRHLALFKFIASKGYALVFSPYPSGISHNSNNQKMLDGFIAATDSFSTIIDTSRIGLMGHSYGAGATPWVGKELFVNKNWGENGRFMFLNASWFIRQMSQEDLNNFPDDCKFICQVNEYDSTNDHRMSIDLFCNINIPESEKDFIIIPRDSIVINNDSTYIFTAGHNVLSTNNSTEETRYDAHDYYAIFRLLDALAAYTFEGDAIAKEVALGNGSLAQISMGEVLQPLVVTDHPTPIHPQDFYFPWPCHTDFFGINPRIDHCNDECPEIVNVSLPSTNENFLIHPNPTTDYLHISTKNTKQQIVIYNSLGHQMGNYQFDYNIQIDLTLWPNGVYWIVCNNSLSPSSFVKK